ncbi:immunoglobulin-like domain-containing protein [Listeria booriae]|uniref:immunoglobulin-like domain-containing protein n=1 Tax=Listeria booriae TaxID=1552123 RepID=UPI0036F3E786
MLKFQLNPRIEAHTKNRYTTQYGEFKFYSFDKVKSVTDEVIIVALDKAGNVLDTKTIEVVK